MKPILFDYSRLFPNDWAGELATLKSQGAETVLIPVYWGVHEKTFGIRDFSKSSRLKLEKVFSLVDGLGLKAKVLLGFFPDSRSFPDWTAEVSERAIVPSGLWTTGLGTFETRSVPSILSSKVRNGFFEFAHEVLGLCSLYRAPEGPISEVVFEPGVFQADLRLIDMAIFGDFLKGRYQDISRLNLAYQTLFKDFGSVASRAGLRTLFDKRSWLAGWDFRSSRRVILQSLASEFDSLLVRHGLKLPESRTETTGEATEWELLFEDTLVESCSGQPISPLVACGQVTLPAVLAFRVAESLRTDLAEVGKELKLVEDWTARAEVEPRLLGVMSSRYLPSSAISKLRKQIEQGQQVFFALGLPHLTETMEAVSFGALGEKARIRCGDQELMWQRVGAGAVFYPVPEWSVQEGIGKKTIGVLEALHRSLAS